MSPAPFLTPTMHTQCTYNPNLSRFSNNIKQKGAQHADNEILQQCPSTQNISTMTKGGKAASFTFANCHVGQD